MVLAFSENNEIKPQMVVQVQWWKKLESPLALLLVFAFFMFLVG